jgi:3-deoxy-manno-octulosonate cytidylyltransferase (CMP-KDO synthetase)
MVCIVIPARFKSTRYPGKPLVKLQGKEAILWTLEAATASYDADLYVATDDARIARIVEAAGGRVVMTSESCRNGTERVAEAAEKLALPDDEIVVNFQGDAPLTPSWFVGALVERLESTREAVVATPILRCDEESYRRFKNDRAQGRVGATTVVVGRNGNAIYFSKEVVPFLPDIAHLQTTPVYHHVGIYGYRKSALRRYVNWPVGPLESAEQLEQLRFIENGLAVQAVEVDARGRDFWELNNPEDVSIIEAMMLANARLSG